jgi:hypothetical protein
MVLLPGRAWAFQEPINIVRQAALAEEPRDDEGGISTAWH